MVVLVVTVLVVLVLCNILYVLLGRSVFVVIVFFMVAVCHLAIQI